MTSQTVRRRPSAVGRRLSLRQFGILAVTTAVSLSVALGAQAPAPPPAVRVLTLEQALEIAATGNRDVQKAGAYGEWVKGKYWEERSQALPQVVLTGEARRDSDSTMTALTGGLFPAEQDTGSLKIQVDQTLFAWGKLGAVTRAAREGVKTAEERMRLARQATRLEVTRAFYGILLAKELEAIALRGLALKEKRLQEAETKSTLGTATDYDVLAARVAAANARPAVVRSAAAVQQARSRLRLVLGMESGEVDAEGTLAAEPTALPGQEEAFALALKRRPELAGQTLRVGIYRELLKIAKAGDKPRLDLSAAYARKWLAFGPYSVDGPLWNVGVVLKVPLFDGMRTKGQVLEARSDLTTEELELASLREQIALDVRVAVDSAREAAELLRALEGTEGQAERLLTMAEKGYDFGVKTLLEVEDAQVNLTQARGNLAVARRDYLVARAALERAMGVLGE